MARILALLSTIALGGLLSAGWAPLAVAQTPVPAPPPPQAGRQAPPPGSRAETIDSAWVRASAGIDRLLPPQAEAAYRALSSRFQPARAMETVTFMDRFWRLAGNPGYEASLGHMQAGLAAAGFAEGKPAKAGVSAFWVEEYPNGGNGWELVRAQLTVVEAATGKVSEPVFDPIIDYIALAMNSFSTPPGGLVAPLVYVGAGINEENYAGVDVKGAVVLGDASLRALFQQAVRMRGAVGVISAQPPPSYTRPDQTPEVFQWGGIPYDQKNQAFGFTASRLVADRLKARLRAGAVKVRAEVETRFHGPGPGRLLVAEIPGRTRPDERVVMVAHIQEPGSNDNASGCATQLELARALQAAIIAKAIEPPARTLTFVWGDEIRASHEWLRADQVRSTGTRFMLSLDMTGEDEKKTGGSFLIEREPDPAAVWYRPSDPHTEWWGGSRQRVEQLRGSLLSDLFLAVCLRRARDTKWNVQSNPYEGGSDHTVFFAAGIPSALATHFTDRYYHTNLDRPDKTSPAEMANVGISAATTAWLLASANQASALAVLEIVARAARARLDLEARQSTAILERASDRPAAEESERQVLAAWRAWYLRALQSVLTLPVTPPGARLEARVRAAVASVAAGSGGK